MRHELAPESRWRGWNLNILIAVLILAALVLVGGLGMQGGWTGPG